MPEFYKYFKENMEGLNLPAPDSIFSTVQSAVATTTVILSLIEKFGRAVTIRELIGAGTNLECLAVIGACSAVYYVGAVIGSIAVATGRSLASGMTIADVLFTANRYDLNRPWLISILQRWPGIYDQEVSARSMFRFQAAIT